MTMISSNRLRYTDADNKVLAKDLGEINSNASLNQAASAAQDVTQTALAQAQQSTKALQQLQQPIQQINQSLSSGAASSQMLTSINNSVNTATGSMRSLNDSLGAVTANANQISSSLSTSVVATVNQSLSQVPGAIGKPDQISAGVKENLLFEAVGDFAKKAYHTTKGVLVSASAMVGTYAAARNTVIQAGQSINAAKQSFDPPQYRYPVTQAQSVQSAYVNRLMNSTQTLAGTNAESQGTTSQLLPVTGSVITAADQPALSNHALFILYAGITWLRNLYTCAVKDQTLQQVVPYCGDFSEHFRALFNPDENPTSLQLLGNFYQFHATNAPDNPSKWLYTYGQTQTLVAQLVETLRFGIDSRSSITAIQGHLSVLLSSLNVRKLLPAGDYDQLLVTMANFVGEAVDNTLGCADPQEFEELFKESFVQLVTTAVLAHRASDYTFAKKPENASEIAVFIGLELLRRMWAEYMFADQPQRDNLLNAMAGIFNTQLKQMECAFTDRYGLVNQGSKLYYQPSMDGAEKLGFALLRHYHQNRTAILKARKDLMGDAEQIAFDQVTLFLDECINTGLQTTGPLQTLLQSNEPINLHSLSEIQKDIGRSVLYWLVGKKRYYTDAIAFGVTAFEVYYAPFDAFYMDDTTISVTMNLHTP